MQNAFEIIGSYVFTFVVIGAFALGVIRRGRRLADRVDDEHKYWT